MFSKNAKQHNYFREKTILQEEEKTLKIMLTKFQNQLNRLKIEELALLSLIKMQKETSETCTAGAGTGVKESGHTASLDSISDTASVSSSIIPVGLMYESVPDINKESLDLQVKMDDDEHIDDFEEEEEEEDEDEDKINDADCTDHLRAFMDSV